MRVTCGGGLNHRLGLDNGVMIKDNHIAVCGGITKAVQRARRQLPVLTKLEVECDRIEQVEEALEAGVDVIMLDNMSVEEMKKAVELVNGRTKLEASGGINLGKRFRGNIQDGRRLYLHKQDKPGLRVR